MKKYIIIVSVILLIALIWNYLVFRQVNFSLIGSSEVTMSTDDSWNDPGYTLTKGNASYDNKVNVTGEVLNQEGIYKIIYKTRIGLFTKKLVRTINVLANNPNFKLELNGDSTFYLIHGKEYSEPGFVAYDILQFLFALVFAPGQAECATVHLYTDGLSKVFDSSSGVSFSMVTVIAGILFFLWLQSLYALGGTFFRRFQWLIVTLLLFIMMFVVSYWVKVKVEGLNIRWLLDLKNNLAYVNIALAILTVFNYWLSFRFFKRTQVINNRFVNI